MSRYVTLPHAVYGVYTPSRCVCTQFCGVRHPNVSISEPRMKRSWIGVFFIHPCWPSPSSIYSVALLFLHHCRRRLWIVLYRLFLQRGCGTITRTSNAVESFCWQMHAVGRALMNYYCETWSHGKKEKKAKKKKPQRSSYMIEKLSDFLFAEGLKKKRQSKKKSRKKADIKTKFPISYFGHACPM